MTQARTIKSTPVFSANLDAYINGRRYIINQGGTRSGKTWSILQLLFLIAQNKPGLLISVVSETMPHLRRGAMRDFETILHAFGFPFEAGRNKTQNTYQIGDSSVEFFSADNSSRLRGAARDILFINECNNLTARAFDELEVRTRRAIFLDFNPVAEFYVHRELIPRTPEAKYKMIRSTYRDNTELPAEQIAAIESRRERDPAWWRVYGEGEIGNDEGTIFTRYELVDEAPADGIKLYGLDFGYTNDPTALISITIRGDEITVDEILYRTEMTNAELVAFMKAERIPQHAEIIADSAEPKSIAEIYRAGFNVHPAAKGADSVRKGIDTLKAYRLRITKRSVETIKEFRNYRWKTDKDGRSTNQPGDFWNHAIDAIRYAVAYKTEQATGKKIRSHFTTLTR